MDKNINRINVIFSERLKQRNGCLSNRIVFQPQFQNGITHACQPSFKTSIILFFLCFFVSSLPLMAQPATDTASGEMVVWHKDGSKILFSLAEKPKIEYTGDSVIIKSSVEITYPFQAIKKMTFERLPDYDSVRDITTSQRKPFTQARDAVTFMAADRDMHVKIVTISGMVISNLIVKKDNPVSITLREYHSNVVLIVVNGVTYKILVP